MPDKIDLIRYRGLGDKRGGLSAVVVPLSDPLSVGIPLHWWRPEVGLSIDAAGAYFCADGDLVGNWRDQVGGMALKWDYAVRGTAVVSRPMLVGGQSGVANGRRYLRFDGVDDYLAADSGQLIASPFTWAACLRVNDTSVTSRGVMGSDNFPVGGQTFVMNPSGSQAAFFGTIQTATIPQGTFQVWSGTRSDSAAEVYQGTTSLGSTSGLSAGSVIKPLLGCIVTSTPANFMPMDVAEVLVYSGILNATDLLFVQNYLKTKYGA